MNSCPITPDEDKVDALCGRIRAAMELFFGDDARRIAHALAVLHHADAIRNSEGGSPLVVRAAALLHDIGIHEAERKHASTAGRFQEIEGPPIARRILEELGVGPAVVDHVCRIVGSQHSGGDIDTLEFRILWDADWLVNLPEEHAGLSGEKLAALIHRVFRTDTGRAMAEDRFLP